MKCPVCGQSLRKLRNQRTMFCLNCCLEFFNGKVFGITEEGERVRVIIEELVTAREKEKAVC